MKIITIIVIICQRVLILDIKAVFNYFLFYNKAKRGINIKFAVYCHQFNVLLVNSCKKYVDTVKKNSCLNYQDISYLMSLGLLLGHQQKSEI